jgi:type VI secretion system protein ImpK
MQNPLRAAVKPMIDYLLGFRYRLETGAEIDLYGLRKDILNTLQTVDVVLRSSPGLHSRVETIRYLLVGLADEVILSSTWSKAKEWREKLLEMELFKTSVAGERFFDLLERDGYRDPELADFFYICLALGFRGKYRSRENEIGAIKQRVYAVSPSRLPDDERMLTPGADFAYTGGDKIMPRIFGISTVVAVLVVATIGYFIASQWLWSAIAETIHAIARSLG